MSDQMNKPSVFEFPRDLHINSVIQKDENMTPYLCSELYLQIEI
jgi:hypothetical protein